MCRRVIQKTPLGAIQALFGTVNAAMTTPANYNGAPEQCLPIVRLNDAGRRSLDLLRWGLIPSSAKDIKVGALNINAEVFENVAAKPAFRKAFSERRCLVPVDGFYEWQKRPDGTQQPYAIVSEDGLPLVLAGVWERWTPIVGSVITTFAIVTGTANELCAKIHNRMPVILPPLAWCTWLGEDDDATPDELIKRPYSADLMRAYPIGPRVDDLRNNDPALLDCIGPDLTL